MSQDPRIAQLVNEFVAKITSLARETAVTTLSASFAGYDGGKPTSRPGPGATRPAPSAAASPGHVRRKGAKRPAADVERLKALLTNHIAKNPGQRVEQINASLGTQTREVARPLAKLIEAGTVKSKGARRGTTYHPA